MDELVDGASLTQIAKEEGEGERQQRKASNNAASLVILGLLVVCVWTPVVLLNLHGVDRLARETLCCALRACA